MTIPKTMQAAVLTSPDTLEIREKPTPAPGPEDVLIRVESCAVCSSDVSLMHAPWPGQPPFGSFTPGHEYAGVVVATGETVDECAVGDRVAVEVHFGCTRCENCRRGNYTACLNWGSADHGHRANGLTRDGGFAQYAVNHVSTVHPLPDWTSFEEGSLITNLGCVLYGFEMTGAFLVGEKVAIVGEGPLGLLSVQVAKLLGSEIVYLVGLDPHRLAVGGEMGADVVINAADSTPPDPAAIIKTDYRGGVDLAVEASGSEAGLRLATLLPRWTGKTLIFGIPKGEASINFNDFIRGNKYMYTVRGEGWSNCRRAASLLRQRRIDLGRLATHSFPLSQIAQAFDTHVNHRDNAIKVIVRPGEG